MKTIKDIEIELDETWLNFDECYCCDNSNLKLLMKKAMKEFATLLNEFCEETRLNPTEIAERIVIEYANISGRESTSRGFVRIAAIKVLSGLNKVEEIKKKVMG